MPAGATNSLLSLIVLLAVGVGDLAWLNLVLAPRLGGQQAQTVVRQRGAGDPSSSAERPATDQPVDRSKGAEPLPAEGRVQADAEPAQVEPAREDTPPAEAVVTPPAEQDTPPAEAVDTPKQAPNEPAEAKKPPEPASRQPLPRLDDILFGTGSAGLNRSARVALRRLVKVMVADKQARLVVRGHADERGREDYNNRLAAWRGKTVLRYLMALGIPASRVSMESLGARDPADPADTPAALARNRRVQLVWQ